MSDTDPAHESHAARVPIVFDITHTTEYRYARPVELGEHRLMFRPRDSHDLRVLATDLKVEPGASNLRLIQDAYENSVALVQPESPAETLTFTCLFTVEHTPVSGSWTGAPADYLGMNVSVTVSKRTQPG